MTTKTPGGRITGHIALGFEAQEALEVGDVVMITGDYEVNKANGTKPHAGYVSVPNKKRTNSVAGTSVGDPNVPGDCTVEVPFFSVQTTDNTGAPFDAGVEIGVGSDGKLYAFASGGSPVNEVQTATITGAPAGGTFTLTWNGQTTAGIAFDASAADVKAALEALSNIAAGDITVTKSGAVYTVTFGGDLAGENVAAMTASGSGLTGGTSPGVSIATGTSGAATTLSKYGISLTACGAAGDTADIGIV